MPSNPIIRIATACTLTAFLLLPQAACSQSPETYLKNGKEFAGQGKYNEAILEFRNAIEKNPQFVEAHYQLGLVYERAGLLTDAAASLSAAPYLGVARGGFSLFKAPGFIS